MIVIKGDDLVKKHQVYVPEIGTSFLGKTERRLCVFEIIIGEISHQAARERRQAFDFRTLIFSEDLPDCVSGMLGREGLCRLFFFFSAPPDRHLPVHAGQLHRGSVAQERVAAPFLIVLRALQEITVAAGSLECPHHLNGGEGIAVDLPAGGNPPTVRCLGYFFHFFQCGKHDFFLLFLPENLCCVGICRDLGIKKRPRQNIRFCQGRVSFLFHSRCHLDL